MEGIVNLQWFYNDFTMQNFAKASHTLRYRHVVALQVGFGHLELMVRRDLHPRDAVSSGVNKARRPEQAVGRSHVYQ